MGLRETLNQKPVIPGVVVCAVILIALVVIVSQVRRPEPHMLPLQIYYTTDDGRNWFLDDATKFPPFERDGREAVRAFMFSCDGGQTPFVGYLMKYTPEARQRLIDAEQNPGGDYTDALENMPPQHILFKAPGGDAWLPGNDPRAQQIQQPTCPDGSRARAVLPR